MNKLFVLLGLLGLSTLARAQGGILIDINEDFPIVEEIGEFYEDDGEYTEGIIVEDPGHDINYEDGWDWEYTEGIIIEDPEHDINYEENWNWEPEVDFDFSEGVILGEPTFQPEVVELVDQDGGFLAL